MRVVYSLQRKRRKKKSKKGNSADDLSTSNSVDDARKDIKKELNDKLKKGNKKTSKKIKKKENPPLPLLPNPDLEIRDYPQNHQKRKLEKKRTKSKTRMKKILYLKKTHLYFLVVKVMMGGYLVGRKKSQM